MEVKKKGWGGGEQQEKIQKTIRMGVEDKKRKREREIEVGTTMRRGRGLQGHRGGKREVGKK